jgi:hypothetical protein
MALGLITDRRNGEEGVDESESIDVIWPRPPPCIRPHGSCRIYMLCNSPRTPACNAPLSC